MMLQKKCKPNLGKKPTSAGQSTLLVVQIETGSGSALTITFPTIAISQLSAVEAFVECAFDCSQRIPMSAPKGFNGRGLLDECKASPNIYWDIHSSYHVGRISRTVQIYLRYIYD